MKICIAEKKCPRCGKVFYPTAMWAYKMIDREKGVKQFFCSWSCFKTSKYGGRVR